MSDYFHECAGFENLWIGHCQFSSKESDNKMTFSVVVFGGKLAPSCGS